MKSGKTFRNDGKKNSAAKTAQVVRKVSTKNGTRPECAVFGRAVVSAPAKETASFMEFTRERLTTEVSDRRRHGRWSARSTLELPSSVERRSGAAVRSTDLVRPRLTHNSGSRSEFCSDLMVSRIARQAERRRPYSKRRSCHPPSSGFLNS